MSISKDKFYRQEYLKRINQVMDYIDSHLSEAITLEQLAQVADFSAYHFHRIFSALVGETVSAYIKRLRLEKAASKLVLSFHQTITDIALECGFANSAMFAREFKKHFKLTPSAYRKKFLKKYQQSKNRQIQRKNWQVESKQQQAFSPPTHYINEQVLIERRKRMTIKPSSIKVKTMPAMKVAYCRHQGAYKNIGSAFDKINKWAKQHGLFEKDKTIVLGIYHDDPKVTDVDKLRSSACVTIPEDMTVTGAVDGTMDIEAGQYVVARFEISKDQFDQAWNYVMGEWLPSSGYQPADNACYEIYLNDPKYHPQGKFIVDICEPVKAM